MSTPLSLVPPAAVLAADGVDLRHDLPGPMVAPSTKAELATRSRTRADELAALDPASPQFRQLIRDIEAIGDRTIRSSSEVSNRLLDSPESTLKDKGGTGSPVATTLAELRRTVENLDPAHAAGKKKLLGLIPFGNKINDYFRRFESQRSHLDAIVESLGSSRDELRKDNDVLTREQARLWEMLGLLKQDVVLVEALDQAVTGIVEDLDVRDPAKAKKLRETALFSIRQKQQDLMMHHAVTVQGSLAIGMVISNNTELAKGVQRATTTTVSALRTAVMTSQALSSQKQVVDQVSAVNGMTSGLIERTADLNKSNSVAIQKQAAESAIDMEALKKAFASIYDSMDEVDRYRAEAAGAMRETVTSLRQELGRAQGVLAEVGDSQ